MGFFGTDTRRDQLEEQHAVFELRLSRSRRQLQLLQARVDDIRQLFLPPTAEEDVEFEDEEQQEARSQETEIDETLRKLLTRRRTEVMRNEDRFRWVSRLFSEGYAWKAQWNSDANEHDDVCGCDACREDRDDEYVVSHDCGYVHSTVAHGSDEFPHVCEGCWEFQVFDDLELSQQTRHLLRSLVWHLEDTTLNLTEGWAWALLPAALKDGVLVAVVISLGDSKMYLGTGRPADDGLGWKGWVVSTHDSVLSRRLFVPTSDRLTTHLIRTYLQPYLQVTFADLALGNHNQADPLCDVQVTTEADAHELGVRLPTDVMKVSGFFLEELVGPSEDFSRFVEARSKPNHDPTETERISTASQRLWLVEELADAIDDCLPGGVARGCQRLREELNRAQRAHEQLKRDIHQRRLDHQRGPTSEEEWLESRVQFFMDIWDDHLTQLEQAQKQIDRFPAIEKEGYRSEVGQAISYNMDFLVAIILGVWSCSGDNYELPYVAVKDTDRRPD